jgi:hypothetical protein
MRHAGNLGRGPVRPNVILATAGGRRQRRAGELLSLRADLEEAVTSMAWSWQFEQADGSLVPSRGMPRETFSSQGDAESWLGENWRDLLASGVDQVTLLEEGRIEYGPMSLHPEG